MFVPWRINMVNRFLFAGSGKIEWKEPDPSIVDDRRGALPGVPLALVPEPWRTWIAATAGSSSSIPMDGERARAGTSDRETRLRRI